MPVMHGIRTRWMFKNHHSTWKAHVVTWMISHLKKLQGMGYLCLHRCQPRRAKRRLVDPGSREAALLTRRA